MPDASSGSATQSPAAQHAETAPHAHHQPFQPYPYYPYYMPNPNQFQQSPYQAPMYGQPFGKSYGNFPGQPAVAPSPAQSGTAATTKQPGSLAAGLSNGAPTNPYSAGQQFYPTSGYEEDYGKPYTQNFSSFGSTLNNQKQEYKGQVHIH